MRAGGIKVSAIPEKAAHLPNNTEPDFGLVSSLLVSHFEGPDDSPARALKETFAEDVIDKYKDYWRQLSESPERWSPDAHPVSFEDWVNFAFGQ
jgi:hypothetical protein